MRPPASIVLSLCLPFRTAEAAAAAPSPPPPRAAAAAFIPSPPPPLRGEPPRLGSRDRRGPIPHPSSSPSDGDATGDGGHAGSADPADDDGAGDGAYDGGGGGGLSYTPSDIGGIVGSAPSYWIPPSRMAPAFDAAANGRYACTRFRRSAEPPEEGGGGGGAAEPAGGAGVARASVSDPAVVRQCLHVLNLSRRAPSGFNAQPYRVVLVHSTESKEALARYCLGRNADRVRDSDCTAVFLADREVGRDWARFGAFLGSGGGERRRRSGGGGSDAERSKGMGRWGRHKVQGLVLLFSSGYPLPWFLSAPIAFFVRLAVNVLGVLLGRRMLVPTLSSADTWATKNTMLVAMSYLLGCTSRGLATCPMEGYWAPGVRGALGIPRRFSVPLLVSVGLPFRGQVTGGGSDDVGMTHGPPGGGGGGGGSGGPTRRYPMEEVVFGDSFGRAALLPP